MSDAQLENRLKEAKRQERDLSLHNREVKNFVQYLRVSASDRSTFVPCCCGRNQLEVDPAFHRAFKYFSRQQKIEYYSSIVNLLKRCLSGEHQQERRQQGTKSASLYFYNQEEDHWEIRRIEINFERKSFKFSNGGHEINLHYYILRNSKKKDKRSLALESIQSMQVPATIRLSNNKESFQELKETLQKLIFAATKEKMLKMLQSSGLLPRHESSAEKQQLKLKKNSKGLIEVPPIKKSESVIVLQAEQESPAVRVSFPKESAGLQYEKMKVKLINSLTNFANLGQTSPNVFVDLKESRVRKVYQLQQDEYQIPLEWFGDNLMNTASFRRWKKTVRHAKQLRTIRNQQNTKIFYEQHQFKQRISQSYIYRRQKYQANDQSVFFFDTPASDPSSSLQSSAHLEYVVWKFERNKNYLIISVEGRIQHEGVKVGTLAVSLTEQFLGDIDRLVNNNATLLGDSNFNINTVLFEEHYLSMFGDMQEMSEEDQFYSISFQDEEDQTDRPTTNTVIKVNSKNHLMLAEVAQKGQSRGSLTSPLSDNYLKWKHPMTPFPKNDLSRFRTPKNPGQSPFWEEEFRFSDKGEMISINTKKLEAQKGVLAQLVKSVGRNLFSGKSILNISLPVTVFSYESNLSLLCKSFCYGPMHLQRAAKASNPVQRMKWVVAFALGCTNAYIQMDKPFNPILGETYHGLIDGCTVCGEQTSHHPPISSVFMKGRGYTVYGSYQAKVSLGLNSAKGSNEGITFISFDATNIEKQIVKFTTPPGEVGGVMWGDRTIRAVNNTQYLDVQNRLFMDLHFGKNSKGTTEFKNYINGIEGKLVQLGPDTDLNKFPEIKPKSIVKELGIFSGKWTEVIYFDDELICNLWSQYPHMPESYPCPLLSDAFYRKDLLTRIEENMQQAQIAKEELQNIQREDRKLRKKYTGHEE